PALVESVMINPLAFYGREGMPLGTSPVVHLSRVHYLSRAARDPKKWLALLTGKTTLGFTGIARLLLRHLRLRVRRGGAPARPASAAAQTFQNGHPFCEDLPGDLRRAVEAGRRLTFFFGTRDPSHRILMF